MSVDNENLGQIVGGVDQESKKVDVRISKGRNALFSLLAAAFQTKCLISPVVKYHIFKTYIGQIEDEVVSPE